jgi:hypothetical protein
MAVHNYTLKSDGTGTHVSIVTWEADAQAAHGVGDQTILECYKGTTINGGWQADGSLREQLIVAGWTTSLADDVTIKAAAGEEHNGVELSNGGNGFALVTDTVTTIDFQVFGTLQAIELIAENSATCVDVSAGTTVVLDKCIITNGDQTTGSSPQTVQIGASTVTMRNCLLKSNRWVCDARSGTATINNCTLVKQNDAVTGGNGYVGGDLINCIGYGFAQGLAATASQSYCATSDGSASGTGAVTGLVEADFTDYAGEHPAVSLMV